MQKLAITLIVFVFSVLSGCGESTLCTFEEQGIAYCWDSKKDVSWLTHCSREVASDKECVEMGGQPTTHVEGQGAYGYGQEVFSQPCTCHGALGQCLASEARNMTQACADFYAYVN